ncbi:unnamed protein product [Clonostachys byssicola]|uniref:F-box domain-containing protein n=1 Tax=Clonostachys byssicola TaxID=160290 RepID=A0A9N9U636_9HYPO|nr:unnamed protein product [Clonostachys byssicola]
MDIFAQSFTLLNIQQKARSLERLPQEILRRIVEHDDLETRDRKAISLTCSTLRSHALPKLFRRITISQLWQDRENFLHICDTPDLAQHVREVEWQEISWYPGFFSRAAFYATEERVKERVMTWLWCWHHFNSDSKTPNVRGMLRAGDLDAELAFRLDESINNLFWFFTFPDFSSSAYPTLEEMCDSGFSPEDIDIIQITATRFGGGLTEFNSATLNSLREFVIASFRRLFQPALRRLPYLTGVLSRPMDPGRVVCSGEHELQARHFQTHRFSGQAAEPTANDGLFLFLFPAIEGLENPITRLLWQDEDQYRSCARSIPCKDNMKVFEHLQKLELSFYFPRATQFNHPDKNKPTDHISSLPSLLRAATSLTHLVFDSNLQDRFYLPCIRSTRLVSLELHSSAPVTCDELIPVLQRHSNTLRHIRLDSSSLVVGSLNWIREDVPNLRLQSCRLMGATQTQDWVHESHVLDYLNGHASQDQEAGQRGSLGELLFKRIAIFTEDDLMGAPCWEVSEESEDSDTAEESDSEFSEGSAADDSWTDRNARVYWWTDEAFRQRIKRRTKVKGWHAPRNSVSSHVYDWLKPQGMEMDEDCDPENREKSARGELNNSMDCEMLEEDDTGKGEGRTEDRENGTSWEEECEIDAEDGCADDEMEEEEGSDGEDMDVVEDSESAVSSVCVETNERFVKENIVYSEFVDVDSEQWESNLSEYMPSSSSEGEED